MCLAIFFLDLELGEVFALRDARNLPSEGKGVGLFPAGQSSRRGQCNGTDPFNQLHSAHAWIDTRALHIACTTTTTLKARPGCTVFVDLTLVL